MFLQASNLSLGVSGLGASTLLAAGSGPSLSAQVPPSSDYHLADPTDLAPMPLSLRGLPSVEQFRDHGADFSGQASLVERAGLAVFGENSVWHNFRGLGVILGALWTHAGLYSRQFGKLNFLKEFFSTLKGTQRLAARPEYADQARELFADTICRYMKVHGCEIDVINGELLNTIGKDEPVVFLAGPHASIFPDFALAKLDPKMVITADQHNFRNFWISRWIGLAHFMDAAQFSLVVRLSSSLSAEERAELEQLQTYLFEHAVKAAVEDGARSLYYPQAGRVPVAWNALGEQERSGVYAALASKSGRNPWAWSKFKGAVKMALELAQRTQQTVKIPIIAMEGFERVMPNKGGSFPYIQKNYYGERTSLSVARIVEIPPPSDDANFFELQSFYEGVLQLAFIEAMDINGFLQEKVTSWAQANPNFALFTKDQLLQSFIALADTSQLGEHYYVLVDRIRSIPPVINKQNNTARGAAISALLSLVVNQVPADDTLLDGFVKVLHRALWDTNDEVAMSSLEETAIAIQQKFQKGQNRDSAAG